MTILHNVTKLQNHKYTGAYNILHALFQASATRHMRTAFFWVITQDTG